jgi:uncharacterized membrane protein
MFLSNPWFTSTGNEIVMVRVANLPTLPTMRLLLQGYTYHEHPPLSDLILHAWLVVTGGGLVWLRLPSILFFIAGLWVLSLAASEMAGPTAAVALIWVGTLWPYGFHYGRVAGWYAVSFFLTALVTWTYLKFIRLPSWTYWSVLVTVGIALVYTNYFGWALVACLAVDYWTRHCPQPAPRGWHIVDKTPLGTLAIVIVAFGPLMRPFFARLFAGIGTGGSLLKAIPYVAFHLYLLFVGEGAAPWILWLGTPVGICVALSLIVLVFRTRGQARLLFVYFLCLMVAMALLGILSREREILIAPWLVLPLAVTLASMTGSRLRCGFSAALAVIAAIGWFGIVTGRYYAMPNLRAPWQPVAERAAQSVRAGAEVIGDNAPFFFYLSYALQASSSRSPGERARLRFIGPIPGEAQYAGIYNPIQWISAGHPLRAVTLLVKGAPSDVPAQATAQAEKWLDEGCRLRRIGPRLTDPGFAFKERFARQSVHWRVYLEVREYDCRRVP